MAVFFNKVKTAVRHNYHTSNFLGKVSFRDRTGFPQARYLMRVDIDLLPARSMQLDQMKRCDGCGEDYHHEVNPDGGPLTNVVAPKLTVDVDPLALGPNACTG